ncbi:endoplasmic reticulum resident protein 27 isoform X2 [Amia ocellicauda]|uniref:endoplasmic reticulum resident protein 27 isoform X2 n=1 Tax=Amia ocellicauda TaxID=2972642 RepID=UPI003463AB5A
MSADSTPLRLSDVSAAEAFVESAEVVVIGFFKEDGGTGFQEFLSLASDLRTVPFALCSAPEVWQRYNISMDTVSLFRQTDSHQEKLQMEEGRKLESDSLLRFVRMNELRYLTEYNAMTAVGLFSSSVQTHLLLFADQRSEGFAALQSSLAHLAPTYRGQLLFVLVDGATKSNSRSLSYFGLRSSDLPAVGLYDTKADRKWLLPPGEVTTERVQQFCESFLSGELQSQDSSESSTAESKSEL